MMKTNLLHLNNDILNIIGGYVKKDNLKKEIFKEEQIINGKKIRFDQQLYNIPPFIVFDDNNDYIKDKNTITKDDIKRYLFRYVNFEIIRIKVNAKNDKIKLSKVDIRMCILVCFQRCKLIRDN